MASTVTSTPSDLTLSAGFSSSKSGTISWTAPTVPDGATIKSCVLTGKATASNTNIKSITINDQSITVSTSGYNFTIDLGTDTSITSVTATMTKSGWSTYNVKFTNMIYIVTYDLALVSYTVTFKNEDGSVIKTEQNVSSGTRVSNIQPTISKEGYTFLGWYDEQGNEVTKVTSDIVLTARFKKNPILTVTQNAGGYVLYNNTRKEGNFTLTFEPGSSIDLTANANDGYYIKSMIIPDIGNLIEDPDARATTYPFSYDNINTDESLTIEYARVDGTEEPSTTSNILIGNNRVNKIYIGNTSISKVYLGDIRIF